MLIQDVVAPARSDPGPRSCILIMLRLSQALTPGPSLRGSEEHGVRQKVGARRQNERRGYCAFEVDSQ